MVYQGILGGKLYNGDYSGMINKALGKIVTASYFTGAGLSLFTRLTYKQGERRFE